MSSRSARGAQRLCRNLPESGKRLGPHSNAKHKRTNDRRRLAQPVMTKTRDRETRVGDFGHGVAVAVAALSNAPVEEVQPILPSRQAGLFGADVFDEKQPPPGLQNAAEFGKRAPRIPHRAQHESRNRDIEASVAEGKI